MKIQRHATATLLASTISLVIVFAQAPPQETGPFRQPDLVELIKLDPTLRLDIRYATANNFLGRPVYKEARAFLQRPAAEALVRVNRALRKKGLGLLIFDGYRPWSVTKLFWDATPEDKKQFVADPGRGSRHNRGCAVDLTMFNLQTGQEVTMPSAYDEMSERSHIHYQGGTAESRRWRDMLRAAMEAEGFTVYEPEWWHYDYKDWKEYPILNLDFSEIGGSIQSPSPNVKALVGGTLIDGFGSKPIHNSVIIIEGERIKAVGQVGTLPIPPDAEIISTEGMTVLPGLWDMHVHLMINGHSDYAHWDRTYPPQMESVIMPASARQLLLAGVTSARDLGAPLKPILAVRDRINRGEIPGPTLYVSGPFIQHEPYPGTEYFRWGVNGAADARAKVRMLAEAGVNCIKLFDQDQMTMEEVQAVVDEAHKHNLTVVAHAHRPEEIRRGLQTGVDCFEHTGLATAPEYPPDVMAMIRERTAKMNLGPLFWTPTVQGLLNYEYIRDNPEQLDDPSWQLGLPESIIADIKASIQHPERLAYYQITPNRRPTLKRKIQQLIESGVVLLIGTDSGVPLNFHSQSTWRELDAWVNAFGIDPMTAIRAATYWPSVLMKVDNQVGTISPGKYADIIAVRGDVLRYINLLQNVAIVIKRGTRYK